jgi:hypothetical protein
MYDKRHACIATSYSFLRCVVMLQWKSCAASILMLSGVADENDFKSQQHLSSAIKSVELHIRIYIASPIMVQSQHLLALIALLVCRSFT